STSRIFQNQSAKQIIETVLRGAPGAAFDLMGIRSEPAVRGYCVQYRESDFDFVSRLMEEEGIFYFFRHADGEHKMHLADSATAYYDAVESEVEFEPSGQYEGAISSWSARYAAQPGKWTQRD